MARGNDAYDLLISDEQEQNKGKLLYEEKGKLRYIFYDMIGFIIFIMIIKYYNNIDPNMHIAYMAIQFIGLVFVIFKLAKHFNTWRSKIEIYEHYIVAYGYQAYFNMDGLFIYPRNFKKEQWGSGVCYGYGYSEKRIYIVFPKWSDIETIVVLDKMDSSKIEKTLQQIGVKPFSGY